MAESAHEKMIAEKMARLTRYAPEPEARRAQQSALRRWAETIYLFKTPLGIIVFGGTIFISYRYIGNNVGNLLVALVTLLFGIGLLYAAYLTFSHAVFGSDHDVWNGNWPYRRGYPSSSDITFERFGALVGTVLYFIFGSFSIVISFLLFWRR
jgi:hypothetical protein